MCQDKPIFVPSDFDGAKCSCAEHGDTAAFECAYLGCSEQKTGIYDPALVVDNSAQPITME